MSVASMPYVLMSSIRLINTVYVGDPNSEYYILQGKDDIGRKHAFRLVVDSLIKFFSEILTVNGITLEVKMISVAKIPYVS